jgi:hypothetical protein
MIRFATERVFFVSHYKIRTASSGLDIISLLPRPALSAHLPSRDLRLNREGRLSIF